MLPHRPHIAPFTPMLAVLIVALLFGLNGTYSSSAVAANDLPPIRQGTRAELCTNQYTAFGSPGDITPTGKDENGQPIVTTDDAREYFYTRWEPYPAVEGQPPRLAAIEFMSACDVALEVNHDVGRLNDEPLVLMTLLGTWTVTGPPEVGTLVSSPNAERFLIFDAHTGNLIGSSFGKVR